MALHLRRRGPGSYETLDGRWAIIRTEWDGPRGGHYYLWEIATPDPHGGWIIDGTGACNTLRGARENLAKVTSTAAGRE